MKKQGVNVSNTPILTLSLLVLPWMYLGVFFYFLPLRTLPSERLVVMSAVATGGLTSTQQALDRLYWLLKYHNRSILGSKWWLPKATNTVGAALLAQLLHHNPLNLRRNKTQHSRGLQDSCSSTTNCVHSYLSVIVPDQLSNVLNFTPGYFLET